MKTLSDICDQFEKDLTEMGVTNFVYNIGDPDSDNAIWNDGNGTYLWSLGAIKALEMFVMNKFQKTMSEEDEEDEDWH